MLKNKDKRFVATTLDGLFLYSDTPFAKKVIEEIKDVNNDQLNDGFEDKTTKERLDYSK